MTVRFLILDIVDPYCYSKEIISLRIVDILSQAKLLAHQKLADLVKPRHTQQACLQPPISIHHITAVEYFRSDGLFADFLPRGRPLFYPI